VPPKGHRPAYRIDTERLVIRCWNPGDALLFEEAIQASLEHLRPWMPWAHDEPVDLQTRIDHIRQVRAKFDTDEDYWYGVFDTEQSRVLGATGLHIRSGPDVREIGYWIRADATGQGLITESTAALVKVAFEVDGVHRVEIHNHPDNLASAAIARKLGFTHEATLRERIRSHDGQRHDSMIWTLMDHEYPASPAFRAEVEAWDALGRRLI
jgi:RimJ/RimL family protein N-acetyltransferase